MIHMRLVRRLCALAVAGGLGMVCGAMAMPQALAQPAPVMPFVTPNTDTCPNKVAPPPPIDTSEVVAPGEPSPPPLPAPSPAVGGDRLAACGVVVPLNVPGVPNDISATSWVVADLDSGKVLAAKDPHGRYRPASTIKTLLAIVALRSLDMNKVVIGTPEDANADGTRVGIGAGGRYTNKQLIQALLMSSGNDAAHALSAQLGGDDATVLKMNAEAKRLRALDTRAATPAGLDGPGMSTSAYDLAAIFREAMTIPTFAEVVHTEQVDFPGYPANPQFPVDSNNADRPGFPISNDNRLLYDYDGTLGGKTGFTDDARQTLVTAAERNGHRLVVTLLKADVQPIRPPEQATRLLDWGFGFPPDASVGTLPDHKGAAEPTSVALASPPPHAEEPSPSKARESVASTAIAGGLVVAAALLLAAWSVARRSRHR